MANEQDLMDQALELAFLIAERLKAERMAKGPAKGAAEEDCLCFW